MARSSASSRALTDHDEIRQWAESRDARPACVRNTGGADDVGMIRLDFPGYTGADSLEEISWDEWLGKFDESNLALIVQNETANGQTSNFNKLVSRDSVEGEDDDEERSRNSDHRQNGSVSATRRQSSRGSTRTESKARSGRRASGNRSTRESQTKSSGTDQSGRSQSRRTQSDKDGSSRTRMSRSKRKSGSSAKGGRSDARSGNSRRSSQSDNQAARAQKKTVSGTRNQPTGRKANGRRKAA